MSLRARIEAKKINGPVPFHSAVVDEPVFLHRFTHTESQAFWLACQKQERATIERQLVGRTLVDEHDKPLYKVPDEIKAIAELPGAFVSEIFVESSRLNNLTDLDVEETRKRFFASRVGGSSTGSPGTSVNAIPTGSANG